ncbi:MAG: hypothetical protein KC646_16295 [Candidatus Cloacimonetes bacterium]|nr:hypothetical protein [Candidatus Cloacimonadota bacterium]
MAKKQKKSGIGCLGILFILSLIASIIFVGIFSVVGYIGYDAYTNPARFIESHKDGFRSTGKMIVGVFSSSIPFDIPDQELDGDAFDSFTQKSIQLTNITQDLNKKDQDLVIELSRKEFLSGFMTEFYKWEVKKYDVQFTPGAFDLMASVEAKVLFPYIPKDTHPLVEEALLSAEILNIKLKADVDYDNGLRNLQVKELLIGNVKLPDFFLVEISKKLPETLQLDQHIKKVEQQTKVRVQQLKFSQGKVLFKGVYNPSK